MLCATIFRKWSDHIAAYSHLLYTMLNAVEHMNFFEGRATEYSKASTQGNWIDAFS